MVPNGHILTFTAGVTALVAITGPTVIFTIGRGPAVARRSGLTTVTGAQSGLGPVGSGSEG
jgi:threonine/homoserine/homoserine lactone efflux protein